MKLNLKFLLLILLSIFLFQSCISALVTKKEIEDKVNQVKPLKPEFPKKNDLNPEVKYRLTLIKKAINSIESISLGLDNLEKKKYLLPYIHIETFKKLNINKFINLISKESGYKIEIDNNINNIQISPKKYEYTNLFYIIKDLANTLHSEVVVNFKTHIIKFTNQVTKNYFLPILPGEETIEVRNTPSSLSDIGGGSSGSSDTDDSGKFEFKQSRYDVLKEVENVLKEFDGIKKIIVSKPTSEIIVSGNVDSVLKAERYIKKVIKNLSVQIEVFLTIVEVRWTSSEDRDRFFESAHTNSTETFSASIGNDPNTVKKLLTFEYTKSDPFASIRYVLNLLNTYGKSKIISNTRALAQNSYPITLFSGRIIQYISSTIITYQDNRQIITPVTSSVSDGLTLHLIPKYIGNNKILFILIPRLSTVTFTKYTYAGSMSLTLPTERVHQQYVRFIANSGSVYMFGAVQYGSDMIENNSLSIFSIPISDKKNKERRDVLFILMGRLIDLSGRAFNDIEE